MILALRDNTALLCGDNSWQVVDKDPEAVYYPMEYSSEAQRLEAGAALAYQVVAEGSVLLTNNGALPLAADKKVTLAAAPAGLQAALEGNGLTIGDADAAALIMTVTRAAVEGTPEPSYLLLNEDEITMLAEAAKLKADGKVKSVILLLHTAYPIQMDFMKNNDTIDACLWIGDLDASGMNAVADILVGKVNPSGRLTDTYCYDIFSAPAMKTSQSVAYSGESTDVAYQVWQEGIYVGYKYYETRYEDYVMGLDNVGEYQYYDDVAFPFGHGLSYTTFQYSDLAFGYDQDTDQYEVVFCVLNTGNVAGRETVQIYVQTPYKEYDVRYGVEKPAVSLVSFAKTGMLEPGEAEEIVLYVDRKSLASFDVEGKQTYIMDAGEYFLTMATDAHDAVNNILASEGYYKWDGRMDADGDPLMVYGWVEKEMDPTAYTVGNLPAVPEFGNADPNRYVGTRGNDPKVKTVTWLSRSDWEGTMPTGQIPSLQLTEEMRKTMDGEGYDPASYGQAEMPKMGEARKVELQKLMGEFYSDSMWDKFLNQLTFEEMVDLLSADFYQKEAKKTVKTTAFPAESMLAATFDRDLCYNVGLLMGDDFLAAETVFVEGPDASVRRTPLNSGSSEDAYLSGEVCTEKTYGLREKGVNAALRYLGPNASGEVAVWINEQAARENYLHNYRSAIEFAGAMSVMTSDAYLGATQTAASEGLINHILRAEWGFEGMTIASGTDFSVDALLAGTSVFAATREELTAALQGYKNDPVVVSAMREACHRNLYALVNSAAMNGIGDATIVQSEQQPQVNLAQVGLVYILIPAAFWLLPVAAFVMWQRGKKLWVNTEAYKNYIALLENQKK